MTKPNKKLPAGGGRGNKEDLKKLLLVITANNCINALLINFVLIRLDAEQF
jgi:hypothetical protein